MLDVDLIGWRDDLIVGGNIVIAGIKTLHDYVGHLLSWDLTFRNRLDLRLFSHYLILVGNRKR